MLSWTQFEDVHQDQTVFKRQIKDGEGWEKPKEDQSVTIDIAYKRSYKGDNKEPDIGTPNETDTTIGIIIILIYINIYQSKSNGIHLNVDI